MILLRAFASLFDYINYIFGTHIPSMPPQTYGAFMALAFVVGIVLARKELARRTNLGIFNQGTKEIEIGKGINWLDVLIYALFAFFVGLKLVGILINKAQFLQNPQEYFVSMNGSVMGGIVASVLAATYIAYMQNKEKLPAIIKKQIVYNVEDRIGDVLVIAMIGGVLGSKILDAFDNPNSMADFIANPISSLTSGLSVLGGLWLVSILLIYYAKQNKIKILPFTDSLAPPFFLAYAIGRLGCQFSGDGCWGIPISGIGKPNWLPNIKPNWLPDILWGNTYPHNVNRDGIPIPGCLEPYCHELPVAHLPTPLYETIFVSILFLILWNLRKHLTPFYGAMTGLFFVFNGVERFLIEFVRVNKRYDHFGFHLSQAQYMSFAMLILGLGIVYWSMVIQKKTVQ